MRSPVPQQQFLEPVCWIGGDPREDVGEPGLRIDVVHFGGDDQAIHGGGARPAAINTFKIFFIC